MTIKEALQLKPVEFEIIFGEETFTAKLRRPSLIDLMEAIKVSEQKEVNFAAWLVWKHLMDDRKMAFDHLEDVMRCDANMVMAIADKVQELYNEGSK